MGLSATAFLLGDDRYTSGEPARLPDRLPPDLRARQPRASIPGNRKRQVRKAWRPGLVRLLPPEPECWTGSTPAGTRTAHLDDVYYSFDIGNWHLIALNSNCGQVGGCQAGSIRGEWLQGRPRREPGPLHTRLLAPPALELRVTSATTAPRAPSGRISTAAHADVVLNGHGNHHYERHAPQNASRRYRLRVTACASSSSAPAEKSTAARRDRLETRTRSRSPITRASGS